MFISLGTVGRLYTPKIPPPPLLRLLILVLFPSSSLSFRPDGPWSFDPGVSLAGFEVRHLLAKSQPHLAHGWLLFSLCSSTGIGLRNWRVISFLRWSLLLAGCLSPFCALGQIDPVNRELVQVGYNAALQGHSPLAF